MVEQGKPYVLPMGRPIARKVQCTEGRGCWKKRRSLCNVENKGSTLPYPKGGRLPTRINYMKELETANVSRSMT